MDKINFQNLPSTTTPINATNLNQMQDNIEDGINGDVIYNNPTGANDNISLTQGLSNYSRIKIFSKIVMASYTTYYITECQTVIGGSVSLEQGRLNSSALWINDTARYLMNTQSLTKEYESDVRIGAGGGITFNENTNRTLIYKIIGYTD